MPRKSLNRTYVSEESILEKLNENINSCLPSQLKKKYSIGKSIGDGKLLEFFFVYPLLKIFMF